MGIVFRESRLKGAFIVEPEKFEDERGFFGRSFSQKEFSRQGISTPPVESNISFNRKTHTIRGLHFQSAPHAQAKLVRCTRGAIYDVMIDLRSGSPTRGQWEAAELTANNHVMLYVPEGFAHGFQTLEDDSEVFYEVWDSYVPGSAGGIRWDDPAFGIRWPETREIVLNERDRTWPDFRP